MYPRLLKHFRVGIAFLVGFSTLAFCVHPVSAVAMPRLDPAFGIHGLSVRAGENLNPGASLAFTRSGDIVIVGSLRGVGEEFGCLGYYLASFKSGGAIEHSFGTNGLVEGTKPCRTRSSLAIGRRGHITLGGSGGSSFPCSMVDRFRFDGFSAPGWGSGGMPQDRLYCYGPRHGQGGIVTRDVSIDSRGRVLIAADSLWGSARTVGVIFRVKPNGDVDKRWRGSGLSATGVDGVVRVQRPSSELNGIVEVSSLRAGKVLAATTSHGGFGAAQFLGSGIPDPSFGTKGHAWVDADSTSCSCSKVEGMARDHQGRIILAGFTFRRHGGGIPSHHRLAITRFSADGKLDRKFGVRGVARPIRNTFYTSGVAIQRDGKILVSGQMDDRFAVVRLLRNGQVDPGFFNHGVFKTRISSLGGTATDVRVDSKGRIVAIGGVAASEPAESSLAVVRILPR